MYVAMSALPAWLHNYYSKYAYFHVHKYVFTQVHFCLHCGHYLYLLFAYVCVHIYISNF